MRTGKMEIHGKEYMITMNNRVLAGLEEKGISLEEIGKGKKLTNTLTLIFLMINAGSRLARLEGLGDYPAITMDELMDYTTTEDYERFLSAALPVIQGDRKVDAVPGKNGEAARAEGQGN